MIHWAGDGKVYPHPLWTDFGPTLLQMWTARLRDLISGGSPVILRFMEGPWFITIENSGTFLTATPHGENYQWKTTVRELADEMCQAIDTTVSALRDRDLAVGTGLLSDRAFLAQVILDSSAQV